MGKYFLMCTLSSSCQAKRGELSPSTEKITKIKEGNNTNDIYIDTPQRPQQPPNTTHLWGPLLFGIVQMLSHLSAGTNLHKRTLASGRMTYGCPARNTRPSFWSDPSPISFQSCRRKSPSKTPENSPENQHQPPCPLISRSKNSRWN